jgi:hypothetical protein
MKMKQLISVAGLVLSSLSMNPAQAHGDAKPLHGRILQLASKGITGKLTVLQGSNKIEADIKEASDNTLRVMGVKLGKGDKLVAALSNVVGKNMTVWFTIK